MFSVAASKIFMNETGPDASPPVEATELTAPDRKTAVFQFDLPAASLPAGLYTCQVNVVDDAAGTFTFPRLQLYVRQ